MSSNFESSSSTDEQHHRGHAEELLRALQLLREELCDVVLIAGNDGRRVSGHRIVLSACSQYFKVLFTGPMCEARQSEVRLGEVHGDCLLPLVQFCYTGKIEIRGDNVDELLQTASRLQINGATSECCSFIISHLDVDNCLGVFKLAEQLSLHSLKFATEEFICNNFYEVSQLEEFRKIDFSFLAKLIASDSILMPTEESVFDCVMSWVQHDPHSRNQHIPELLALVRLSLLEPDLMHRVWDVGEKHGCLDLLQGPTGSRPRKSMTKNLLLLSSADCFNTEGIKIEKYCDLTKPPNYVGQISERLYFSAAMLNDKLIVVGGCNNFTEARSSVESFDLRSKSFTTLEPISTARYSFGVAVLEGCLYAVGGRDSSQRLNSVERYDPVTQKWSFVAPMSVARNLLAVAVLDNRLYAVGGFDGSNYHNSTEYYNPLTNLWTQLANLNQKRAQFGLAASKSHLYAVGGLSGDVKLTSVERYDPHRNLWTQMCSLINPRYSTNCVFHVDVLMAIGGVINNKWSNSVETYDEDSNTWVQGVPLAQSGKFIRTVLSLKE